MNKFFFSKVSTGTSNMTCVFFFQINLVTYLYYCEKIATLTLLLLDKILRQTHITETANTEPHSVLCMLPAIRTLRYNTLSKESLLSV